MIVFVCEGAEKPAKVDPVIEEVNKKYDELLESAYAQLRARDPSFGSQSTGITIRPPRITLEARVSVWHNFGEICALLHRPMNHFQEFLHAEWATTSNLDSEQRLIVRGKFKEPQFQTIIRKYVSNYVKCNICHSIDTQLVKEDRLTLLQCNKCNSKYNVGNIHRGFEAQVGRRQHTST